MIRAYKGLKRIFNSIIMLKELLLPQSLFKTGDKENI